MEFKIKRSSYDETKPCPEAYQKANSDIWYVKVETLEDLFKIIEDTDCGIIIFPDDETTYELEVYDDYRE